VYVSTQTRAHPSTQTQIHTHKHPLKNRYNKTTNKLYSLICRQPKSPVEALLLLGPFCTQIGLFCRRKALVYTNDTPGHFFGNQPNFFVTKEKIGLVARNNLTPTCLGKVPYANKKTWTKPLNAH